MRKTVRNFTFLLVFLSFVWAPSVSHAGLVDDLYCAMSRVDKLEMAHLTRQLLDTPITEIIPQFQQPRDYSKYLGMFAGVQLVFRYFTRNIASILNAPNFQLYELVNVCVDSVEMGRISDLKYQFVIGPLLDSVAALDPEKARIIAQLTLERISQSDSVQREEISFLVGRRANVNIAHPDAKGIITDSPIIQAVKTGRNKTVGLLWPHADQANRDLANQIVFQIPIADFPLREEIDY